MKKLIVLGIMASLVTGFHDKDKVTTSRIAEFKQSPIIPFQVGENLVYDVQYGWMDAGRLGLQITETDFDFDGHPILHMKGVGTTAGALDWFYKVRDRYETYMDVDKFRPHKFVRRIREGKYKMDRDYTFDHHNQEVNTGKKGRFKTPADVQDMLSSFYYLRTLDMERAKPGDIFLVNAFMDFELFPFQVKYLGTEHVRIKRGRYECYKFVPVVQEGRVFKDEEDLRVWISRDHNKIPILAKANVLVGSLKMELSNYSGLVEPLAQIN